MMYFSKKCKKRNGCRPHPPVFISDVLFQTSEVFKTSKDWMPGKMLDLLFAHDLFFIFSILFLLVITGCLNKPLVSSQGLNTAVAMGNSPRTLAILPFRDLTDTEGIAELVRTRFYGHFSARPYTDIELLAVDTRLKLHQIAGHEELSKISVKKLGQIIGCDAVIFGTVFESDRLFAGIYSSVNVGAAIEIWDTRSCKKIWSDQYTAQIREGGVPLTLLDIPMITVRSGMNLREGVKLQAVDELAFHLAENIPAPRHYNAEAKPSGNWQYALQIGAFAESERAHQIQEKFKQEGFPVFIRQNKDERGDWHRVFIGPYPDREKAIQVRDRIREDYGTESFLSHQNS
jgi:hypothetical protein